VHQNWSDVVLGLVSVMRRAAAFCTRCNGLMVDSGRPASTACLFCWFIVSKMHIIDNRSDGFNLFFLFICDIKRIVVFEMVSGNAQSYHLSQEAWSL